MDKKKLILHLIELTKHNLKAAHDAAQSTYDIATNEESKAENKYDTRGLEASYLAGAQAERVADIKATLASFENIKIKIFEDGNKISLTALVEIFCNEKTTLLLLMPKGGGQTINFENKLIQVVTPDSPLGKNLIGKEVGDIVQVSAGDKNREYAIISII